MTTGPEDAHVLLGAYLLGGLSDEDHRRFTEHLRTCDRCQGELGQVSGLPRLLDLAGPDGPDGLGGPYGGASLSEVPGPSLVGPLSDDGTEQVRSLLAEVGRRRRRGRFVQSALAAAAAVLIFAGGVWLGPRLLPSGSGSAGTHVAADVAAGSAVQVDISLVTRGWGTQLDVSCADLPSDGTLLLWVVDRAGNGSAAATWLATPSGSARVTGATALRPDQIQLLELRTGSGRVLATART